MDSEIAQFLRALTPVLWIIKMRGLTAGADYAPIRSIRLDQANSNCGSEPAPFAYGRDHQGAAHRVDVRCGYVERRNLVIEFRYGDDVDRAAPSTGNRTCSAASSGTRPCCVEENKMSYHIEINEYQRRLIMKALTSTDVNQFSQAPGSGDAFDTEAKEFVCLVQMFGTLDLDDTTP